MKSFIAVMHDIVTDEVVTTFAFDAEDEDSACYIAAYYAVENGYVLGDIVMGAK